MLKAKPIIRNTRMNEGRMIFIGLFIWLVAESFDDSGLTIVLRQGGPSASNMEQGRNPALACSTLVSRFVVASHSGLALCMPKS